MKEDIKQQIIEEKKKKLEELKYISYKKRAEDKKLKSKLAKEMFDEDD